MAGIGVNTNLSLKTIATAGGQTGTSVTLGALRGKTLFDATVTSSVIPASGSISMSVFKNKGFIVIPIAPTSFTSITPGDSSVALTWTPMSSAGDIVGYPNNFYYTISIFINSTIFRETYALTNSIIAYDLANGTPYTFLVKARNSAGSSSGSIQTTATPVASPPGPPTSLGAWAGFNQIYVNWGAASGTVTRYQLNWTGAAAPITSASSPYIITGLSAGSYTVTVTAYNGDVAGTSASPPAVTVGAYFYTTITSGTVTFPTNSIAKIIATVIGGGGDGDNTAGNPANSVGGGGGSVVVATIIKPGSDFYYVANSALGGRGSLLTYSSYNIYCNANIGSQGGAFSVPANNSEFTANIKLNGGTGGNPGTDSDGTIFIAYAGGGGAAGGNSAVANTNGQSAPTSVPLAGAGGRALIVYLNRPPARSATSGSNYGGGGGGGGGLGAPGCVYVEVYFQ